MKTISSKQFYELGLKKNEALRDVRVTSDYNIEHIDGAFNKPVEDFEKHKEEAKRYDTLYIYCNTSIDSQMFCKYAEKHNINAINIKNGIVERKQKYPTNRLKKTLPLMQQVHITAGALILLGGILFITTGSPLYVLISMAVGLGLFIAGATGFCGMARILSYMPRNK